MSRMRILAWVAATMVVFASAAVAGFFPPPSLQADTLTSGYMRQARAGVGFLGAPATEGTALPSGKSLGRNRWVFDPGPGRDTETSLAVDPQDPDRVLVAWQENITRIWTARTEDGGREWTVEVLQDPASDPLLDGQEGFDPTAAIGPDGTMYVFMGVTHIPGGLKLVRLDAEGWSFHLVESLADVHAWDAMHLAVAPDTGDLYAVAQSIDHRGIGFWQSSDRGDSWSALRFPLAETPQGVARTVQDGYDYWPRIAAGPNGLVVIMTKALLNTGNAIRTTISTDGGATFAPLAALSEDALSGRLVGVPPAFDGERAVAGFVTDDIVLAENDEAAGAWQLRRFPRSDPEWEPDWSTVTAHDGTVWLLHTEQTDGPSWRVLLTRIRGESAKTTTLATAATGRPRGASAGDEYGGLDVGSDGCVWASWAQFGATGTPAIMVAKRC